MHEDEIESKSWISSKLLTVKLSQGRYNEKLHVLKISIHRLEFVSHMTSCVDPLVIFSKAKLELTLTPKLKIHQF
jgi:hypothetical protein